MSDLILYGPRAAPFVTKVRAALALKGLDYTLREPESQEDYRRWNPETGMLPVIEDGGVRVPDSARILDHLDERFPEPPLSAREPTVASAQRRLERWVEETFLFYWLHTMRSLVDDAPPDLPMGQLVLRATAKLRERPSAPRTGIAAELPARLDDLTNFLGRRPFFYADAISRADLAVFSFLSRLALMTPELLGHEVDRRPMLKQHTTRVAQLLAERGFQP